MKTIQKAIGGALLLGFTACSGVQKLPVSTNKSDNNDTYFVSYLFEYDGCKVYRFYDRGEYIYFTNCQGDVTSFVSDSTHTRIENHIRIEAQE
ncbi:DUF4884 domain-containing protein [uncultured Draconibacterium sp.]|uniref:DUF4884 domain-containing protein n=1 Tax=uncultured Draconibacterium sp. TaxID=1573823 RepID=UPI0029C8CF82|nr:DUF4884 domain-containing protein [uncultured Draconibacterium sp.]